jgi:hypothetical protein
MKESFKAGPLIFYDRDGTRQKAPVATTHTSRKKGEVGWKFGYDGNGALIHEIARQRVRVTKTPGNSSLEVRGSMVKGVLSVFWLLTLN